MSDILAVGDVFEVACAGGIAYVSYAGKHGWLGDAIWIVPSTFESRRNDFGTVFAEPGYFAFYPLHAALRQKIVRKVGFAVEAIRLLPVNVRSAVNRDALGRISSWLITDGQSKLPRTDEELSYEERQLPIGTIWNHKMLCERIGSGWNPLESPQQ